MKTLLIIFSIVGFIIFSSCNQTTDPGAMLENTASRNEIFNAITGNHDMMTAFMESMKGSDHAMQMMSGDKMMMKNMMQSGGMEMMMKDGGMMGNMMQMMHKDGMMSDECMQAMKNMMSEKGMNINDKGNMNKGEHKDEHH